MAGIVFIVILVAIAVVLIGMVVGMNNGLVQSRVACDCRKRLPPNLGDLLSTDWSP